MVQDAMKIPGVVARTLVATHFVLDVELGVLAVLFRLIVLLSILDEAPAAVVCSTLTILGDFLLARHTRLALMKLLHESLMRFVAMLSFGVSLRPLLRWRRRVLRAPNFFLAFGGRFVLVVVLSVAHQSISLRE